MPDSGGMIFEIETSKSSIFSVFAKEVASIRALTLVGINVFDGTFKRRCLGASGFPDG